MKILHTSDWHLGQKFISHEREEEHGMALDWLVQLIEREQVEVLLVAGDIFDIGNPPSSARALYYNFLKKLWKTQCRHVVVTGGNHDSPQMLEAPKEILSMLNVYVVGKATEDVKDEVIVLKNNNGVPEAVVAAVPFLRDQDLKRAVSNETSSDRIEKIKEGIVAHYKAVGEAVQELGLGSIPKIVMGHLCVTGLDNTTKQDNIYLGNVENIRTDQFPELFDYVALGHIHRPQSIGGCDHIRYSGSLIPLSFSENKDTKSVTLVAIEENGIKEIHSVKLPVFRRLKSIEGDLEQVQEKLEKLHHEHADSLPSWVEVIVEMEAIVPNLNGVLQDFVKEFNLEILKTKTNSSRYSLNEQTSYEELDDLKPVDVFRKKCESSGHPPENIDELIKTFMELQEWMQQQED